MNNVREWARRIAILLRRHKFDLDMDEEIRAHLALKERELQQGGLSPAEAHAEARRQFGNSLALRESSRDSWGWTLLEHLAQDLHFAFRKFRKSPAFTAVAILTLALGIGANSAIFSVVDAILLRPLPIRNPSQVVVVQLNIPKINLFHTPVDPPSFHTFSRHTNIFESTALYLNTNLNLTGAGQPQRLVGMRTTASLFPLLGVHPLVGRTFTAAEDVHGAGHVVLLSEALWKELFGAASNVIGRYVQLDRQSYEIIGVLPAKLQILYPDVQFWIPMALSPRAFKGDLCCTMLGRLRPNITRQQAQTVLGIDAAHEVESAPPWARPMFAGFSISVTPLMQEETGDISHPLYLLLGAVLFLLLIACANVANLLLARGSIRSREMAIRAAIGAGRRRIVAQLLTESLLLSLAGGALGLLFAWWGITALVDFAPANLPHPQTIHLDASVLAFTFIVSALAGIFFGVAPAMQASKVDLTDSLKESIRSGPSISRHGLRRALVLSEIALTSVLLVGAGLLLQSFAKLLDVNPGFNPTHLLTLQISPSKQVSAAQTAWRRQYAEFSRTLLSRISAMPGVLYAALSDGPPLMHPYNSVFLIRGYHPGANGPQPHADTVSTSPEYFTTMKIPLLYGRTYTDEDIQAKNPVVVVDEALANRFWPGQSALGKQVGYNNKGPWYTIIGVVGTVRSHTLARATRGTLYFPAYYPGMSLLVRTVSNPAALAPVIRAQIATLDPTQAVYSVKTMSQRISESVAQQRFATALLALFAVLALILAAIGLYSVMAYVATQRTHEIGVRMALGAQRRDVLRLVLGQGARLALIGVALGVALAFALTRVMASLLFGVTPADPITFVGVSAMLLLVALVACYVPARRAMKVDPIVALKYE